jgi:2-keto-4-pentenoate hydratase
MNFVTASSAGYDEAHVSAAVDRLRQAAAAGLPCAPIRDLLPVSVAAGYVVQERLTTHALENGRRIVGHKVGLTNPKAQAQFGVDQPDFGVLFDDMAVPDGGIVEFGRLLQPRIEGEIAMVLSDDLDAADLDAQQVRNAVGQVVVALEIVDSRIAGWDISILDTVADNASGGLYALGDSPVELGGANLSAARMTMWEDEREVSVGTGADCLGDPIAALLWLATMAHAHGTPLRRGEIVLSGALGPMVAVRPGAIYTAHVTGLGSVSVQFTETDQEGTPHGRRRQPAATSN